MIRVSLSSLPFRKKWLLQVLNSLESQETNQVFSVHLYLPKNPIRSDPWEQSDIDELSKTIANVHMVDDIGPLTKVWYSLKEANQDDICIAIDDDVSYPKDLVRKLSFWARQLDAHVCNRSRNLNKLDYNSSTRLQGHEISGPEKTHILTTTWGVAYSRKHIPDELFEIDLTDESNLRNDDLVISGILHKHNKPIYIVPCSPVHPIREAAFKNSLYEHNANGPWNNNLVQRYFSDMDFSHNLPSKLNLGCGTKVLSGYTNIDLFVDHPQVEKSNAADLSKYQDDSIEEVLCENILEHFSRLYWKTVLAEWVRVLKPGGTLKLQFTDMVEVCRGASQALDGKSWEFFNKKIFGEQCDGTGANHPGNYHLTGFSEIYLKEYLINTHKMEYVFSNSKDYNVTLVMRKTK